MVLVVDYGMGNLHSVSKALERLGADVRIGSDPDAVSQASRLVLPGVGAFGDAMGELNLRGLCEPIRRFVSSGRPFLGICLGLQLMFSESEENPGINGLGLYSGGARKFRASAVKVPHMGWNQIAIRRPHPLLRGVNDRTYFYFVHSYYAVPDDPSMTLADCDYGGELFAAVVGSGRAAAIQFHPEKSQDAGMTILKNFLEL